MVPQDRLDPIDVFVDLDQQKMRPLVTGILRRRRRRRRRRLEGIVAFPAVSGVVDQADLLVAV